MGSNRWQSEQSRLEFGLRFSDWFQRGTIWIADAHRDSEKRFVARSDEKLTAFVELELAIRGCRNAY